MGARRTAAALVALTMVLGACSGGGDATGSPTAADPVGGEVPASALVAYRDTVVADHGGAEAFARTWWALDRGYTLEQLTEHAAALAGDGRLDGVAPAGSPLGLLTDPPVALAAPAAGGAVVAGPSGFDGGSPAQRRYVQFLEMALEAVYRQGVAHARQQPAPPDPVEDVDLPPEQEGVMVLIAASLLGRGYSPQQVTEALVLGTFSLVGIAVEACFAIAGERPARDRDLYEDTCGALPDAPVEQDAEPADGDAVEQPGGQGAGPVEAVWEGGFRPFEGCCPAGEEMGDIAGTITIERLADGTFRVDGAGTVTTVFTEESQMGTACRSTTSHRYQATGEATRVGDDGAVQIDVVGLFETIIDTDCGTGGDEEQREVSSTFTVVDGTTIEGFRPFPFSVTGPEVLPEQ